MLTTFKYLITPGYGYKHYQSFDLFIQKKTVGWIWTDVEYVWSCLPGYMSENSGWIDIKPMSDGMCCFELCSKNVKSQNYSGNSCFAKLYGTSMNFNIGDENPAYLSYGGYNSSHLKGIEKDSNDVMARWKLINVY